MSTTIAPAASVQTAQAGATTGLQLTVWSQPASLDSNQPRIGRMEASRDRLARAVAALARPGWQPHQDVDALRRHDPVFVRDADIGAVGDAAIDPVGPRGIRLAREIDEPLRPDHYANGLTRTGQEVGTAPDL